MPRLCRPALVCGVLVLALGGCAREPEPGPPAVAPPDSVVVPAPDPFPAFARRAAAIEIALDDYRRAEGTGPDGSPFTAYLDGESVRLIEETQEAGATVVTYFEDGFPFYIVEEAGAVRTRVAFGPEGAVVAAERTVNGEHRNVPTAEVEVLWSRALALVARIPPPEPL